MKKWFSYTLGVLTEIGIACALALIGLFIALLDK